MHIYTLCCFNFNQVSSDPDAPLDYAPPEVPHQDTPDPCNIPSQPCQPGDSLSRPSDSLSRPGGYSALSSTAPYLSRIPLPPPPIPPYCSRNPSPPPPILPYSLQISPPPPPTPLPSPPRQQYYHTSPPPPNSPQPRRPCNIPLSQTCRPDNSSFHANSDSSPRDEHGPFACFNFSDLFSLLGIHPQPLLCIDLSQPLPRTDLLQPLPSTDLPQPLPSTDLPQPLPSTYLPQPLPSTDLLQPLPSTDLPQPLPSTDLPQPLPSTYLPQPLPSTDLPQPLPSTYLPQPLPSTDLLQPLPSTDLPQPLPSTDLPQSLPSTDLPQPLPFFTLLLSIPFADRGSFCRGCLHSLYAPHPRTCRLVVCRGYCASIVLRSCSRFPWCRCYVAPPQFYCCYFPSDFYLPSYISSPSQYRQSDDSSPDDEDRDE